jgi:hypothetical protein
VDSSNTNVPVSTKPGQLQAEFIAELNDVKSRMGPTNPHSLGMIAEIDNMIAAVRKW